MKRIPKWLKTIVVILLLLLLLSILFSYDNPATRAVAKAIKMPVDAFSRTAQNAVSILVGGLMIIAGIIVFATFPVIGVMLIVAGAALAIGGMFSLWSSWSSKKPDPVDLSDSNNR